MSVFIKAFSILNTLFLSIHFTFHDRKSIKVLKSLIVKYERNGEQSLQDENIFIRLLSIRVIIISFRSSKYCLNYSVWSATFRRKTNSFYRFDYTNKIFPDMWYEINHFYSLGSEFWIITSISHEIKHISNSSNMLFFSDLLHY